MMTDSILDTVKKMLGPDSEDTHFDTDIIVLINAAISILTQLGIGPKEGFAIMDDSATWAQFIGTDKRLSGIIGYIYMKVKIVFDPPTSAAILQAMKDEIKEYEIRASYVIEIDEIEERG